MTLRAAPQAFSELYSAYAAGCLDPAFALLVETQASLRHDVAMTLARGEIIAATLFESEAPSPMADDALDRAFAAIDGLDVKPRAARRAARIAGQALDEIVALPEPLRGVVLEINENTDWRFTAPGIRRLTLDLGGNAETELYRIEPGASVPRHSHKGAEFTLVVAGGFSDETGSFGPGDLAIKGPDDTHQPVADLDGVCFALAVRDGGLQFTGLMGAVQRLLGG